MQWLIIARDGTDPGARERRLAARAAHLEGASKMQAAGHFLIGGALLDEAGAMIGSAAVVQFETRAALDDWLRGDPYVTGDVWRHIEVLPYRVAPHYDLPPCPEQQR
jgi:uncharacterized protein YciI